MNYRMTKAEVIALLTNPAVEGRWRTMWVLLTLTGARESEAIGLRWSDIANDAPLRRITIATQIHHRSRVRSQTKTGNIRVVPEHPTLRAILDSWHREGWRAEYGRDPRPDDLIVPCRGKQGRP